MFTCLAIYIVCVGFLYVPGLFNVINYLIM